jgi:hypothetical protein
MPPKGGERTRRWCFTAYSEMVSESVLQSMLTERRFTYLVVQKEACPTTGRHHWQGYVEFPTEQRHSALKALLNETPPRYKGIPALGTAAENHAYCTKLESRLADTQPIILGGQAKKRGRPVADKFVPEDVIEMMQNGDDVETCLRALGPELLVPGRMEAVRKAHMLLAPPIKRTKPLHVEYHWGAPGVGKSTKVQELVVFHFKASDQAYTHSQGMGRWWDGYAGQQVLIFDDIPRPRVRDSTNLNAADLLRILDRQPYRVAIKGGSAEANWKYVFIISNLAPEEFFAECEAWQRPLLDRLTHVVHYTGTTSFRDLDRQKALPPLHELTGPVSERIDDVEPVAPNVDANEDWINFGL